MLKKKRLLALLIATVMVMAMMPIGASAAYKMQGSGTPDDPFLIKSESDLKLVNDFSDACWRLETDIDLEDAWSPIEKFSGVFEGAGHTISSIREIYEGGTGGFIGKNTGTIKNLSLEGWFEVWYGRVTLGLLAGKNDGTIENCSAKMSFRGNIMLDYVLKNGDPVLEVGGFVGDNNGLIKNCYAITEFEKYAGRGSKPYGNFGSFAASNSGTIENCYSVLTVRPGVTGSFPYIYGFCPTEGTFKSCYWTGDADSENPEGAEFKSPEAMQIRYVYQDWDFDTVWAIAENINDGYPYLQVEYGTAKYVRNISLSQSSVTMQPGERKTITATITPANAANGNVTWTTSNKYIAIVSSTGVIEAVAKGEAVITATTADGMKASCTVTVGQKADATTPDNTQTVNPNNNAGIGSDMFNYDINGDGKVDNDDVALLLRFLMGLE